MKFYVRVSVAFTYFFLLLNVFAQSPGDTLKKSAKQIGGEKKLKNLSTYEFNGLVVRESDNRNGIVKIISAKPNLHLMSFDFDGVLYEIGFNGKSGWTRSVGSRLKTLTGAPGKGFQEQINFHNNLWLNYKNEKSKITIAGSKQIKEQNAIAVNVSTVKGVSYKIFFDQQSYLPVKSEFPFGDAKHIFDYSDYREIQGIKFPHKIIFSDGSEIYNIQVNNVTLNRQISKNAFDFPVVSNEPLPNIPVLLKQLQENEDRIENLLENYTYTQTNISRELDKAGILQEKKSETYQISFYKGNRIRRLVAKDGRSLNANEQRSEDREVEKRVKEIEKEIAKKEERTLKQSRSGTPEEENKRISIAELLRASKLLNPRRERFRERDVIVFDFEPNPDFDYKNAKSFLKFFGKTAGVMWIDAEDKQVARIEAVLADNYKVGGGLLANLKKGAAFVLENDRINNELWLPSLTEINLSVKVLLVKGINVNQLVKYGDYQKFNSEVKDSKVNEKMTP